MRLAGRPQTHSRRGGFTRRSTSRQPKPLHAHHRGRTNHGLDAFHLEIADSRDPTLHLVQAKLSPSRALVRDGVRGFRRTLERAASLLRGEPTRPDVENTVWTRLAARFAATSNPGRVTVHCRVLHLVNTDSETLLSEARAERADFGEIASVALPDNKVLLSLSGPQEILPRGVVVPPANRGRSRSRASRRETAKLVYSSDSEPSRTSSSSTRRAATTCSRRTCARSTFGPRGADLLTTCAPPCGECASTNPRSDRTRWTSPCFTTA